MTLHPVELACFHYSSFSRLTNWYRFEGPIDGGLPGRFATSADIALYILSVALVRNLRWTGITRYGAL